MKRKQVDGPPADAPTTLGTKPSDLELYERRVAYWFAQGAAPSKVLRTKSTPEEQVPDMNAWDFFRIVTIRGEKESSAGMVRAR